MPSFADLERDLFDDASLSTTAGLRQQIIQEAQRQGVDPALALAVAHRESNFNPSAVSPTGVTGLFQVTTATGTPYGQTGDTRRDPLVSMRAGIGYLKDLLAESGGNVRQALARYGDPNEADYPDKVLARYELQRQSLGGTRLAAADLGSIERDLFGAAPAQPQPAPAAQPHAPTRAAPLASGVPAEGFLGPQDLGNGNVATVLNHTVTDPRLNQGRATNIPLIVPGISPEDIRSIAGGARPSDAAYERSIAHAQQRVQRGEAIPSFDSIEAAVEAAKNESSERGRLHRPFAPAFGLQGEALAPETPSGPRLPGLAMSGDVIEDMSSGVVTRAQTPSDIVLPIEKPSTPQPRLPGQAAPSEFALSGDILSDTSSITPSTGMTPEERAQAQHDVAMHWKSLPAAALSAGLVGGVTAGAAALLPEAAQVALPAIGAAANYAARKLNVALDLEEPGAVGDVLSVTMPMLPYAAQAGKAGMRTIAGWTRAGRALTAAEQETADQVANAATQHAARQQAGVEAAQQRQTTYDLNQRRVEAVEARKQAARAQQVLDAQQEAADATATAQHSYAIEQRMAQAEARAAERQQVTEYTAYQDTVQTHSAAVERLQGLPQRYLPQMPARNMTDVQRDLALLEQPTARQQVIERLGATDLNDAVRILSDEGETLMQAGQRMSRPGETIAPSYRQPQPKLPGQAPGVELQSWIRKQGGLRLEGEELHGEFAALVQRKESGAAGLLNNRSGKSAQQLAEAAQEAGYIPTADKESLLDALRQSVNEGKGIYTQEARFAAPPLPGTAPAAVSMPPSAKAPQSASRLLYQRLEEVAGSSPVDLTPTVEVALGLQGQMGQGIPAMQPTWLSRILTDLTEMGDRGSVAQVHSMLKELGPLTRDHDGRIRGAAKQLVGSLQQSLTQSAMEWPETAGARQLLRQANAAYRQEQAVGDLQRILAPGGAVLSHKQGRLTLNPDALLNQVERLAARDPFFKGSFSPDDYAALQADLRSFVGTPAIPRQAPPLPGTVTPREIGPPPVPVQPREIPPLAPRIPTVREMRGRPGDYVPEPFTPPAPVEPTMEGMGPHWTRLFGLGGSGVIESAATGHFPYLSAGILTADMAEYALSRIMLTPQLRPLLRQVIHPQTGQIDPAKLAALAAMVPGLTEELTPAEGGR